MGDFGDMSALEWKLGRERDAQFVDWKIATLEILAKYLLSRENDAEEREIEALGTNSFYHLWEEACKTALADKLDVKLGRLGIPLADDWEDEGNNTLLNIIPHPKWERWNNGAYGKAVGTDTLIPDTVSLVDNSGKKVFCIYDAKYYVPSLSGKMKKQPGLESVTKQFLYQSAYRPFVEDHNFTAVVNAFLVPTCDDGPRKLARVSFPKVMGEVKPPFSNYIVMWALPAHKVFDAYLRGTRIDGGLLRTVWESEV
ncbi:LlaJI family restriction endonuclease [Paraeggerthella sp.]|uniref:LlaJI family restriction endonuclease n=1 Tax=Paraeggerthella sp. TaxID=2897350 RepID=UPI0035296768